jgi:hypothetical protein
VLTEPPFWFIQKTDAAGNSSYLKLGCDFLIWTNIDLANKECTIYNQDGSGNVYTVVLGSIP